MKFDHTKTWKELDEEEQTAWDKKCQQVKAKQLKKLGLDGEECLVDSVSEWNAKHVTTMRKIISAQGKAALKKVTDLKEYNTVFAEYAKKLEAVGF